MVSTEWSRTTKRAVAIGLVILLLLGLFLFRALLPPIAIAAVLAFLLKPVVDGLERRARLPRLLAVILVFLVLIVLLSTIPVTVVPYVVDRVGRLTRQSQELFDRLVIFLSQPIWILDFEFYLEDLVGDIRVALQDLLRPFATQTIGLLFNVASSLLWVLSILVIAFYLVKDADRLRAFLDRSAPPGHTEELQRLRAEISQVWNAFFRGQVLLGIIVGLLVWIAMTIVGLPNAGLMGLLAGMLEVIPTLGPVLATIPAALIAILFGSTYLPLSNFWFAVLVVGIYVVIQQIENAVIVPRIMSRRLQLHPVTVFIGVLAGGIVAGLIGVFLAAPIIATLRVVLRYVHAKLLGYEPFPRQPEGPIDFYPGEIDAILFDLDGTLIETDDDAVDRIAHRLRVVRWLLPRRDPKRAARRIVMACETPVTRALSLLDRLGLDGHLFNLGDRLRRIRGLQSPPDFRPIDGVGTLLRELSRRYYLAIVSTRSHKEAQAFLGQQDLADLIQVVTGRDDTWRIKPHPSPIRHTAEQLGVPVERCLVVGDTTADMTAARLAGARAMGVLCGFGTREELERAGADRILKSTPDLLNWM
jgi:predicted PurR-regulated permease PerM/phosphoglycolate phosphatase-like HAD superfamily hydrolase